MWTSAHRAWTVEAPERDARDAERGSAPMDREAQHVAMRMHRQTTTSCGFRLDHRPPVGVQFTGRSVAGRPPKRQGTRATRPAEQGPGTKAADRSGERPRSYASPHLRDRGTTTRTESLPYPATRLAPGKRTPAGTPIRTTGRHGEVPRTAGTEERNGNGPGSRGCPGHGSEGHAQVPGGQDRDQGRKRRAQGPRRPVRCQLQRRGDPRSHVRAPLDSPRRPSLRRDHVGVPDGRHLQRDRQDRLRAEGRRGPGLLEPARHQRRRQQVLPRPRRHAGARAQRQAAHRPRRQHDHRLGRHPALLRHGRGPRGVPGGADPSPRAPEDGLQLAGLVQRGDRGEAAVLRVLHQLGPGQHEQHHGPRQDRGHAVQVRLRRRREPVPHPLVARPRCRAAASPAARSASCAATTRSRA